ncbi:MAG: permease-like cell division protein FtsX [Actinobacteria bacterium]|nr:permease-like cell division protein FtsX [Actinomycetota bacterium]
MLLYFLRESLIGFRRNLVMSTAAIITVAISLVVVGGVIIGAATIGNIIRSMEQKVEIVTYIKDSTPPESVDALQNEIVSWAQVKSVAYVSKDEALKRLRNDLKDNPEMLQAMEGNPLPASLEVRLKDPHDVDGVAAKLKGRPELEDVKYGQDYVPKLFAVSRVIRGVGATFIVLLSFASLVLIANTIRLAIFARRREIGIMRLVGASSWFIRWPFLLEGIFQGLVGATLAIGALYLVKATGLSWLMRNLPFLPLSFDTALFWQMVFALTLGGVVIGASGSSFALRRFLKV